jgi:hypothetical protein
MGFSRRKMADQRRTAAEKESEARRATDAHPNALGFRQPDDWINATHRMAYIGQETLGRQLARLLKKQV